MEWFLEDDTALARLEEAFLRGTLPKAEWTHAAHIAVAAAWVAEDPASALDRFRPAVSRYNEAIGGVNSPTSGYHETLTRFWITILRGGTLPGASRLENVRAAVARWGRESGLWRQFYDFDVVASVEARAAWVPPSAIPMDYGNFQG